MIEPESPERVSTVAYGFKILFGFLTLIVAAMLWAGLQPASQDLKDVALEQSSTQASATGIGWVWTFAEFLPLVVLGLVFIMMLAGALAERRRVF